MTRRLLVPAWIWMAIASAHAEPPGAVAEPAFNDALSQAYLYNPELAAERRQLRETDEGVPRALSGWRPRVSVQADLGTSAQFDSMDPTHRPERRVPQSQNLTVNQPIYTGGRVRAQVDQAEALVAAERAALQATEAAVLLDAATSYLDVARDRRTVELNRSQAGVLERTVRAGEQQLAAGAVTGTDVAQSRARLADQRARLAQAAAGLAVSRAEFERVIGRLPGKTPMPTLPLDLPPGLDRALESLPGNFDVLQSRAAQDASRQGIDIARAGLRPRLSAELRGSHLAETDVQLLHQRDTIAEATLMLRVPIYQGGEQAAEIRQAKEAAARTLLQTDAVLRRGREQIQSAWAQLEGARTRVDQFSQSREANAIAERGVSRQQSVGQRTQIEVLNAQEERLTAEVNLVSAQRDAYVAGFTLQAATGELSAARLGLDVHLYEPQIHYRETRDRWFGTTPAP